jgi:HCOMODA/2-hydroxy-3-carboxy-muconic semialdehyde decarboxylase
MKSASDHGGAEGVPVSVVSDRGESAGSPADELLDDLVAANRILFRHRVVDAFGHVSVRHDKDPNRFLLARNMAPALVGRDDVVEFHLNGDPVNAAGRAVYLERFIHGEIYRARPDVAAVVHSHAPAVVPFGVARGAVLKPVWHMSGFLGMQTPVFEIRQTAGNGSDLLIRSNELGVALAESLGESGVVLMRGHGATVVAESLKLVVFRSIYTQMNAELQFQAMQLGEVNYLSEEETLATTKSVGSQVDRAWNLWRQEIQS